MATPPSVQNYAVGKGKLSIALFAGGTPGAYSFMGNAPSVEVEPSLERLPHYSSQEGFRVKDANPIIQTDYVVNFSVDEIAAINLNRYLMGTLVGGNVIQMLQGIGKEYALRFRSYNPYGKNQRWDFWKGTLSPNGSMQLIGDEWMVMAFTFEGLADKVNHSASPYADITFVSTTTSTTSTTTTTP
jgi:hypothetical protein